MPEQDLIQQLQNATEVSAIREEWDFYKCPVKEPLTCLNYTAKRAALAKDPTFAERLSPDWKAKYPQWPELAYLQIPQEIRRKAHAELDPLGLQAVQAQALKPKAYPPAAAATFQHQIAQDKPAIYIPPFFTGDANEGDALILLRIPGGITLPSLILHFSAYAKEFQLTGDHLQGPEGAGSYPRQFLSDLNAFGAHYLLQRMTPAEATAYTQQLLGKQTSRTSIKSKKHTKLGLFTNVQEWQKAAERAEYLIEKTLVGQLTSILLAEHLVRFFSH